MRRRSGRSGASMDWDAVRARLARANAAVAAGFALPEERARALMAERARELSKPTAEAAAPDTVLELLAFRLGRERYAFETRFLREVTGLEAMTRLPAAPAFVVGITNLRGEMLAVVDLRKFFGIPAEGLTDLSRLIVLGTEHADFGVLADSVQAIDHLAAEQVLGAPESVSGIGREYLLGVTRDALIVLDGAALLADTRLFVTEADAGRGAE